jgi:hypothetical protein
MSGAISDWRASSKMTAVRPSVPAARSMEACSTSHRPEAVLRRILGMRSGGAVPRSSARRRTATA